MFVEGCEVQTLPEAVAVPDLTNNTNKDPIFKRPHLVCF